MMIERGPDRRGPRSWPVPGDRRAARDEAAKELDWADAAPVVPGTIRPAPGEIAPAAERRRVPESGME